MAESPLSGNRTPAVDSESAHPDDTDNKYALDTAETYVELIRYRALFVIPYNEYCRIYCIDESGRLFRDGDVPTAISRDYSPPYLICEKKRLLGHL